MDNTPAPAPSQADLLFQVAALEAFAGAIKAHANTLRDAVGSQIAAAFEFDGTKCAAQVRIPGTKDGVGTVRTSFHAEDVTSVRDATALREWVETHAPAEIEYLDPIIKPTFLTRLLKEIVWIDDPDFEAPPVDPDADPDAPAVEVPKVAARPDKKTGEFVIVPGLNFTKGGGYKSFSVTGRDDEAILKYLGSINIGEMIGTATGMIEAVATVAGEVGDDPDPVEPASAAVVASEVVAREDAA